MEINKWSTVICIKSNDGRCFLVFSEPISRGFDYESSPPFREIVVTGERPWEDSTLGPRPQRVFWVDIDIEVIRSFCTGDRESISHGLIWDFYNECLGNLSQRGLLPVDAGLDFGELSGTWDSILHSNLPGWLEAKLTTQEIVDRQKELSANTLIKLSPQWADYICRSFGIVRSLLMLTERSVERVPPYCLIHAPLA